MPQTQPAVVTYAAQKHAVELRDVPLPEIGPEDVLLEVGADGISLPEERCGSSYPLYLA